MIPLLTQSVRAPLPRLDTWKWEQWRWRIFLFLLLIYAVMTWGVLVQSPLIALDRAAYNYAATLRHHHSSWYPFMNTYVMFGQRRPGMMTAIPFIVWLSYRDRTIRPVVMFVMGLLILNLSVGFVKIGIGRLGPTQTSDAYTKFVGGDIFPSGHVSNAVVLFGILAMLSTRYKRQMIWLAVFLSVTVGLGTVFLATHWISDVIAGWIAGVLVLLALPTVVPWTESAIFYVARFLMKSFGKRPAGTPAPASEEIDPGELLSPMPQARSHRFVTGSPAGAHSLRSAVQFGNPIRTVVSAADDVRSRRRVEGGQRASVGALRHDSVAQRHKKILD